MLVTIACPKNLEDIAVDKTTAPIWVDKNGNEYFIASGNIEGDYIDTVETLPTQVNILTNVDGLTALAMMGLSLKEVESNA